MLPRDPLLLVRELGVGGEVEFLLWVVGAREVGEDGGAFHQRDAFVVVNEDGDAAVGPVGREPGLFLRVFHYVDGLVDVVEAVGFFELFEEDGDFEAIGCRGEKVSEFIVKRMRPEMVVMVLWRA